MISNEKLPAEEIAAINQIKSWLGPRLRPITTRVGTILRNSSAKYWHALYPTG